MNLIFQNPDKRGRMSDGYAEKNAKGICPKSKLFDLLTTIRNALLDAFKEKYKISPLRPFHMELLSGKETKELDAVQRENTINDRTKYLHNALLPIRDITYYKYLGNAITFSIPVTDLELITGKKLSGTFYPIPHITFIHFDRNNKTIPGQDEIRAIINNIILPPPTQ
jgi:hypothetical protein